MPPRLTLLLGGLFLLAAPDAEAQKEANIWYFGDHAGVDFNSGAPVALTNSAMYAFEGCASIADQNGNLLFYTDGITVWNKNHLVMVNGTGLMGNSSSTQSGVIVPQPGNPNIYYVFTVSQEATSNGFRYSIVDISLQGGLGEVTVKNTPILTPTCEKVTATEKSPGEIWIMTHLWNSNSFYAYILDASGFNTTPVISSVGTTHNGSTTNTIGYMKFSPDGTRLALAIDWGLDVVELFDFDKSTGTVSNALVLSNSFVGAGPYGIEFSPNSDVLYAANESAGAQSHLYQWDLNAGTATDIINSKIQMGNLTNAGALQLAPDGKIYLSQTSTPFLGVVNDPDQVGTACNFVVNGFSLQGKTAYFGLPDFITSYFLQAAFTYEGICFGDTTFFYITSDTAILDSVKWYFGDPASGSLDSSSAYFPNHYFSDTGTYLVVLHAYGNFTSVFDTVPVTVYPLPSTSLGNDTAICTGQTLTLNAAYPDATYTWQDGSTDSTLVVASAGVYYVEVRSVEGCLNSDTLTLALFPLPQPNLGPDTEICDQDTLTLDVSGTGDLFLWQNGSPDSVFQVTNTGLYWVQVTDSNGCSKTDSIQVLSNPLPPLYLGNDTTICAADTVLLQAGTGGVSYYWNNSTTLSSLAVFETGTYWVQITDSNGCKSLDSFSLVVQQPPPVDLGPDVHFCTGTSATLDATTPSAISYYWWDGTTLPTHVVFTEGLYWVEASNQLGCKAWDSIYAFEQPYPVVELGSDTLLCDHETILLEAANPGLYKEWQDGSNQNSFLVEEEGLFTLMVMDQYGCTTRDSLSVEYKETPQADLGRDSLYCFGDSVFLHAYFPEAQYLWNDGSTEPDLTVFMTPGLFHVDVYNDCGFDSDSVWIGFHNCQSCVNMPNVFTPNYDGLNDIFLPHWDCNVEQYTLKVFNRWGQLLFQSFHIEDGWDGRTDGKNQEMGTYAWYITYVNSDSPGTEYFLEGSVTLLR